MIKFKFGLGNIVAWSVLITFIFSNSAFAAAAATTTPTILEGLPQSELNAIYTYPNYVQNYATGTCSSSTDPSGGSTQAPSANQTEVAQVIIGIAKTLNLGQAGAEIGIMTALDESGLKIYANSNVPISLSNPATQAVGNNGDSVGIFQQQPQFGWSTYATGNAALSNQQAVWQNMDPAYAAEAFFGITPGSTPQAGLANPGALEKGLQQVPGWQTDQPWVAASAVQKNKVGQSVYQPFYTQAQAMVNQLWATTSALALPIDISGGNAAAAAPGSSATGTTGCYPSTTGTAGDGTSNSQTQAVIAAGLAEIAKNIPYSYGGGGPSGPSVGICDPSRCPNNVSGFDCSSFMQYVFWQGAQIKIPRTTQEQYAATVGAGHSVQLANIQPGDLIFYGTVSDPDHVAMYVGNNMLIEAPETGMNLHEIPMSKGDSPIVGIGFFPPIGG